MRRIAAPTLLTRALGGPDIALSVPLSSPCASPRVRGFARSISSRVGGCRGCSAAVAAAEVRAGVVAPVARVADLPVAVMRRDRGLSRIPAGGPDAAALALALEGNIEEEEEEDAEEEDAEEEDADAAAAAEEEEMDGGDCTNVVAVATLSGVVVVSRWRFGDTPPVNAAPRAPSESTSAGVIAALPSSPRAAAHACRRGCARGCAAACCCRCSSMLDTQN